MILWAGEKGVDGNASEGEEEGWGDDVVGRMKDDINNIVRWI
jgi:hypothetical protein